MKATMLAVLSLAAMMAPVTGIDCPHCEGKVVEYVNVEVYPLERAFSDLLTINVTKIFIREITPLASGKIEIKFYNASKVIETMKLTTDGRGLAKFKPKVPGSHSITSLGHIMLINVTTVCGDGGCGFEERYENCPEDCAPCWDGVCEQNEAVSCWDCVGCGDGLCSVGEDRVSCYEDCGYCGDYICDAGDGPGCKDCIDCGNGYCNKGESEHSCPQDCPPGCGDGVCTDKERLNRTCIRDCLGCGNGMCDGGETKISCRVDCLRDCGDGVCNTTEENAESCPEDCGTEPSVETVNYTALQTDVLGAILANKEQSLFKLITRIVATIP